MKYFTELIPDNTEHLFILGSGPTLFGNMVTKIWNKVIQHPILAINSSILSVDWREGEIKNRYWFSNDPMCYKWSYMDQVLSYRMNTIISSLWKKRYFTNQENTYFYKCSDEICDDKLLSTTSLIAAIDFVIKKQFKNIYLLGCDHCVFKSRTHFWQFLPENQQPVREDGRSVPTQSKHMQSYFFRKSMKKIESLSYYALKNSISIFNCSYISKIRCFPQQDIRDLDVLK